MAKEDIKLVSVTKGDNVSLTVTFLWAKNSKKRGKGTIIRH